MFNLTFKSFTYPDSRDKGIIIVSRAAAWLSDMLQSVTTRSFSFTINAEGGEVTVSSESIDALLALPLNFEVSDALLECSRDQAAQLAEFAALVKEFFQFYPDSTTVDAELLRFDKLQALYALLCPGQQLKLSPITGVAV